MIGNRGEPRNVRCDEKKELKHVLCTLNDHVPEPPHEELAGQAGVLLDASLQIGGRKCY